MAASSSAPPSSSSSSTGSKRLVNWSIKNYFSARPSSSTNTPVALGPAQPHLPVIAAAAQPVVASGSGIASDASDSMGQAQSTPKAAAAPRLTRGTSTSRSTSPSKHATTVKGSPLKQTTGTWLYISSDEEPAAVSARQAEATAAAATRDRASSSPLEVVVIPRQLPEAIPIDHKGKGKAVDRQLQVLMSEEEDDDDVPDSQDQIALMLLPNGGRTPTRKMASTPERKAPVAAAAFYSPSGSVTRKTVSSPNLKPQIASNPSTKPVDITTVRATRSTPAIEVSSPASATSSSRRSSRPAAAAATSAISTSYTSPFGTSRSARSTSSRQATPRASRSTSTIAAHKPKLTAAALASLSPAPVKVEGPPRTPRRERYMRSPSGSPLSSLGPTPQKPKVKREMVVVKKEPDFFFDFEVHVRKPTLRRERSQTLNELDATDGEDEEDEMVVDEEEEDVVVGASGSKRNSPGSGRKLAHDGTLSGSESDSDSARDSADESDDDIVAAALARAKARREGGTALVTSDAISAHPSSSNALAGPSSPDIRRSSRAIAKGESAAMESERKKQERERSKMKSEMGLAGLASAGLKGKLGMVALQREREERESRGRGLAWEEGKRLLAMEEERGYGSDDSNASTNSSRSMDKKPILHADSLSDLVTAAANVTGDQDDEYAAFAGSPQKREKKAAAQKRADAIADALKSEVGNGGRTEEEEEEQRLWAKRCFWREGAKVAPWVESVEEVKGEWSERVEMAIRAGRQDSKLFPCSLNLFSHVNGLGTPEERAHIAKRLLSLICHPTTSTNLANRASALLDRVIVHASRTASTLPLVGAEDVCAELEKLGGKRDEEKEKTPVPADLKGKGKAQEQEQEQEREGRPIEKEEQRAGLVRLMSVVQGLAGTRPCLLSKEDVVALVVMCARISVDPTSAPYRNSLERTLEVLLLSVATDDSTTLSCLYSRLVAHFHPLKAQIQLELLRTLPQSSKAAKNLRKWLAWGFLIEEQVALGVASDLFHLPPALSSMQTLLEHPGEGPLKITAEMDDAALYHHALILTVSLTDLGDELYAADGKSKEARILVDNVGGALTRVEGRIRADIRTSDPMRNRAKNALTRLSHSLTYQVRTAQGKRSGFDFTAEDRAAEEKRGKPRARLEDSVGAGAGAGAGGQTKLDFAPVATV